MIYIVVEHFKHGDAVPVYRRFREWGRLAAYILLLTNCWLIAYRSYWDDKKSNIG